jgi:predicted protein tyrosine phosphatase
METLSDKIRLCRDGVVSNPYQGTDKKVLFVCSMGLLRSATAARIYVNQFNTRSVGSYGDALVPLTPMLIAWANEIVFVNKDNYKQAIGEYGEDAWPHAKTVVLDIPDKYPHLHPELIKAFNDQYQPVFFDKIVEHEQTETA